MSTIVRDGITLYYEVSGSGPPIVLTHSFLCDGSLFEAQVPVLARSHRVVNVDLRGHGRSGAAESAFSIQDLVDDVLVILDAERIEKAVWMGLSIGGFLSLRAALTRPERVRALILMDTDAGPESAWNKVQYKAMYWLYEAFGARIIVSRVLPIMLGRTTLRSRPQIVAWFRRLLLDARVKSMGSAIEAIMGRDDVSERLGEIRVPTLVLVGEEDAALPVSKSEVIARRVPGAELQIIPQAGHLSAAENPEAVTLALTGFLSRVERVRAT